MAMALTLVRVPHLMVRYLPVIQDLLLWQLTIVLDHSVCKIIQTYISICAWTQTEEQEKEKKFFWLIVIVSCPIFYSNEQQFRLRQSCIEAWSRFDYFRFIYKRIYIRVIDDCQSLGVYPVDSRQVCRVFLFSWFSFPSFSVSVSLSLTPSLLWYNAWPITID